MWCTLTKESPNVPQNSCVELPSPGEGGETCREPTVIRSGCTGAGCPPHLLFRGYLITQSCVSLGPRDAGEWSLTVIHSLSI